MTDSNCPVCDGMGIVTHDVPVDHPEFGKAFPCPACGIYEKQRLNSIASVSRLGDYDDMRLETIEEPDWYTPDEVSRLGVNVSTVRQYIENPEGWLVLYGNCGTGKTHLAAAAGHELTARGIPAIMVTVPELLDHLRAAYAPTIDASYDERFQQLTSVELLILDDLGAESRTPWAQEKLYQIIDHRNRNEMLTIVTTNVEFEDMQGRIASRLRDKKLSTVVFMDYPDFRSGRRDHLALRGLQGRVNLKGDRDMSFGNFKTQFRQIDLSYQLQTAVEYTQDTTNKWLVIVGNYGSGKTHLAAAIAQDMSSKMPVDDMLMISSASLLDFLRDTFRPDSRVSLESRFRGLSMIPLLILEDFSLSSRTTPWAREKLMQLLNHRYDQNYHTIITIHKDKWEVIKKEEGGLFSRLSDTSKVLHLNLGHHDYRRIKNHFSDADSHEHDDEPLDEPPQGQHSSRF